MKEDNEEQDINEEIFIPTIIINIILILISFYLLFLYIKSKTLRSYPCYNFIIISFIILLDNILRLIPIPNDKDLLKYIQAFLLTSLDKLLLTTISAQTLITYLGVNKSNFYYAHEKMIFFSTLFISLGIALILGGAYMSFDLVKYGIYWYCSDPFGKVLTDVIFNSIFLFLNTIFTLLILIYFSIKKEEATKGYIEDLEYKHYFTKILFMFIVNSLAFIESYLIIYDKLPVPDNYIDLVYLITCLIIDLYYNLNRKILKETLKIFCKKTYDKKYPQNNSRTDSEAEIPNKKQSVEEEDDNEERNSFL